MAWKECEYLLWIITLKQSKTHIATRNAEQILILNMLNTCRVNIQIFNELEHWWPKGSDVPAVNSGVFANKLAAAKPCILIQSIVKTYLKPMLHFSHTWICSWCDIKHLGRNKIIDSVNGYVFIYDGRSKYCCSKTMCVSIHIQCFKMKSLIPNSSII